MYPFVYHKCTNEARDTINNYIIKDLASDNYKKISFPNSYSMYMMSYGANFYIPGKNEHLNFSPFGLLKERII